MPDTRIRRGVLSAWTRSTPSLVLTGSGDDDVRARLDMPVVISTGRGDDSALDIRSPDAHLIMGPGDDGVRPGGGTIDLVGGEGGRTPFFYHQGVANPDAVVVALDDIANDGPGRRTTTSTPTWRTSSAMAATTCSLVRTRRTSSRAARATTRCWDLEALINSSSFSATSTPERLDVRRLRDRHRCLADRFEQGVIVSARRVAFDGQSAEGDDALGHRKHHLGSDGSDVLTGSSANNAISGGEGNDLIDGGLGADTMNGGGGSTRSRTSIARQASR